jgi:hypothetical protein
MSKSIYGLDDPLRMENPFQNGRIVTKKREGYLVKKHPDAIEHFNIKVIRSSNDQWKYHKTIDS